MADHERGEHDEDAAVAAGHHPVDRTEHHAPDDEHHERVRIRIADEVERRERRIARIDPHLLEA